MYLAGCITTKFFNKSSISVIEDMVKKSNHTELLSNRIFRHMLIIMGTVFLGLGIIGVFLPILPTTPFLLLAAACYARSSTRFYTWLMNNKWFGSYIKNYREGKGIPVKIKMFTITFLWLTILTSLYFMINNLLIQIILIAIAIAVTIHILTIKTYKHKTG